MSKKKKPEPPKLNAKDIAFAHLALHSGTYTSEQDVWKAEADYLNKLIANRMPKY